MPSLTIRVPDLEASGPVLDVQLANSLTGQRALRQQNRPVPGPVNVRAFVDTGSDMSVIVDGLARQLSLTLIGFQFLAGGFAGGPSGGTSLAPEYSARFTLPNGVGLDITALELPLPTGLQMLIGRDVLSQGNFLYDGPGSSFTLTF